MDTYMLTVTTSSGKKVPLCLPMLSSTWEIGVVLVEVVDEVKVLVEVVDEVVIEVAGGAISDLFEDVTTFKLVIFRQCGDRTWLKSGVDDSNSNAFTNCDELVIV